MDLQPVKNHKGYFVDANGVIYSNKAKNGGLRVLKPSRRSKKDHHLRIMFGGDRKSYFVHRVVYEAFNGPIPKGLIICHKNDNPTDNRICNLYAGTFKDNLEDARRNGKKPVGENCTHSKLTEKEVIEILKLKGKMRNTDIANAFNVKKCTISDIYAGRTWKHIERGSYFD